MKIFSFVFAVLCCSLQAQTHRFIYDLIYRPDSTSLEVRKTNYHLDINPDETLYYERSYFVSDSIEKVSGRRTFEGKMSDFMSKNRKSNDYILYSVQNFDVYKLKDHPVISWHIGEEIKTSSSLKLQKAMATFGGRKWVAWFSRNFPFQEGPYKFHGLPGMIIELYDDKENYHFTLNRSQNFTATQETGIFKNGKNRGVEIPYTRYRSMLLSHYQDPIKFINSGQTEINENNKLMLDDGRIIHKPEDLRRYGIEEQQRIKKYNNPIELDKAVRYPEIKKQP